MIINIPYAIFLLYTTNINANFIKKTRATGQSEILKNVYVDLIIKSRDLYLSYHKDHPGFFTLTVTISYFYKYINFNKIYHKYVNITFCYYFII